MDMGKVLFAVGSDFLRATFPLDYRQVI